MLEYLEQLRQKVGHAPLMVPAVTVVPLRGRQVLLQRRTDDGTWGLHGGAMDTGEDPRQAARREFAEETGLRAEALTLWDVYAGPAHHHVYPNGDEVYPVDIVFLCEHFSGAGAVRDGEADALAWFSLDALPENLFRLDAPILRDIAARLGEARG